MLWEVKELLPDVVGKCFDEERVCRPPVDHGPGHAVRTAGSLKGQFIIFFSITYSTIAAERVDRNIRIIDS